MMKLPPLSQSTAEAVAIQALQFLAADGERLSQFLALAGIDVGEIRTAATAPGFLAGLLNHVTANPDLLAAFAAQTGLSSEYVDKARIVLVGDEWEREMP